MARTHRDLIDHLSGAIDQVTARIEEAMALFRQARALIATIRRVSTAWPTSSSPRPART